MRRPFNVSVGVNYGRDNYSGSGCRDYQCGGYCYDGHSGTDFPLSLGTTVVAAFAGQVTATYNGCANYGYLGNTCGGRCGNYVRIQNSDGTAILYCHLMLNSITVSVGQWVSCGQTVGQSASSGNSTGPHLHLGYYVSGVTRDPFAGSCSQSTSYWVSQGTYPHPIPSTSCETSCTCTPGNTQTQACGNCGTRSRSCLSNCQWGSWSSCTGTGPCSPGQTQTQVCGNCGTQSRSCLSNCQWGGWSTCAGQGPCSPGQTESRACCDCGTEGRSCQASCQWSAWSACSGPDPVGAPPCDTGELGVCADGQQRCIGGCLTCVRLVDPSPELCDNLDNDCDGVPDDGAPQEMGVPPPPYAARLLDFSAPQRLGQGESGQGWAVFENVGSAPWEAGALWLQALSPVEEGAPSLLWDAEAWLAHDVAATNAEAVEPGGFAELVFSLKLAPTERHPVTERFRLLGPSGEAIRCPSSELELRVGPARVTAGQQSEEPELPPTAELPRAWDPMVYGGCGCQTWAPSSGGGLGLGILFLILLTVPFRRRSERCSTAFGRLSSGSRTSSLILAIVLVVVASCGEGELVAPAQKRASSTGDAPALASLGARQSKLVRALGALSPEEELLDAAEDGRRLVGRRRVAPEQSSAWLTYDAWLVSAQGHPVPIPLPDGVLQEARFSPLSGGPIALVDRQGRLFVWAGEQAKPSLVDHPVLPGLAWSRDGASIAYVQGEVPELTLRRYDLAKERHGTIVAPGPPLALPAFSPDGAELVFASARDGVPALYRVRTDGTGLGRLTNRDITVQALRVGAGGLPMPEGNRPPVWHGGQVVYEAGGGVFAVDASRGRLRWKLEGADLPHLGPEGLVVRLGDGSFSRVLE